MTFTITKTFTIKDPTYVPQDDASYFITNFYKRMVDDGVISNAIISADDFSLMMEVCKAPYYESNKIVSNTMTQIDSTTYHWVGVFESLEVYNEYKTDLFNVFNTDFNSSIDTPNISVVIE